MIIIETGGGGAATLKNTGSKTQRLPKPVRETILAKEDFSFTDIAAIRLESNWKTARLAKNIVPLFKVEEIAQNNTDETKFEGRFQDVTLKESVNGVNYKTLVDDDSFKAMQSYEGSSYTRIFRICEDGTVHCEIQSDGSIKGEPLSSYNIGGLVGTDLSTPQNAELQLKFKPYDKSTIKPSFDIVDFEGIYDVELAVIGTPNATTLVVEARDARSGDLFPSIVLADWKFTQASDGLEETVTASTYSSVTGYYTLTATAFETGTIGSDGAIAQTELDYETDLATVTI